MDFKVQRLVSDPNSPHSCGSNDNGISSRDHLSSPISLNLKDSTRKLDDHPASSIRIGFGNNREKEMKPKSALHKSFVTMGKLLPLPSPSLLVQKFQRLWKTQQQIPLRNATTSASSLSDSFCYHHGEFLKNQRKQPIQLDNVYSEYSDMDPIDQELAGPNHYELVKGGPLKQENRTPPTRKFAIRDRKFATRARTIASSRTLGIRTRTIASPTFAIKARAHTSRTFATSSASASPSIDPTPDVVTETLTFTSRKFPVPNPKSRKLLPAQKSKRLNHTL